MWTALSVRGEEILNGVEVKNVTKLFNRGKQEVDGKWQLLFLELIHIVVNEQRVGNLDNWSSSNSKAIIEAGGVTEHMSRY